ncbi:ABCB family ABC transporter ATP-binding protein/permease [Aliikangiella coralliicola]|uniref:ABC transporter ATP-binding protein/permease n=1 Tax=Aliikangiella coralliicola TaxID=2592383 RepID=A0A545UD65_9GAMM|nr:ABC transporter ATP-binding protein/permease [Aliikangiella coralliicola]TQV87383.1 ABC transporter ATP-binding protein/permease [Aliikangiella coralliicola]
MRSSGQVVDQQVTIKWSILKQLLPYLGEFKSRIILALICLVLAKLSTVILPFILKEIVDSLSATDKIAANTETFSSLPLWVLTPTALVVAYGLLRFANSVFSELRDTLFSRVTERAIRRISLKVFQHLHALDVNFHLNRRTGGLARDIERGTHGINFLMRFMVFNIVPTLIEISLVIGILLTNYGMIFGVLTFLSVAVYITFSVIITNWRNKYIRAANDADSASSTRAIDSLLNYETVKFFTNENYESNRYDKDLSTWEKAKLKNRLSLFALNSGQAFIISTAIAALLYLAADRVSDNQMTVGDFVLVNAFMMQLFMPLNFLGFVYREIRAALVNIEQMFGLLATKPKVEDQQNAASLQLDDSTSENNKIEFIDLRFGYQPDREILKGLNFTIESKQTVAIVGGSGAGKSTVARLLLRFYDPTEGKILIGGQNIKDVTQGSLRQAIGIVPQDTVLFNDSIFENIRYGNPDADDSEVQNAINLAHLDEFISQLPNGSDTLVGERGLKLSGGEKQRVAIARALLKRPPIMIFDEATSSLDSHSEAAILEAIEEISGHYTSLVIAHRLSTIVNADVILVLEDGQLVESGSHQELLDKQGMYASLWQRQNQGSSKEKNQRN